MRGRGKGSFRQALFRSVKPMQSLHFPFTLCTTTGFANHVGCNTPLTKPAASSFLISSEINCCRSKACFLTVCLTGRAWGHTARWCSITSLGTPGMSDGCQANTSTFAHRKAMSALSYLSSRVELIVNVPSAPTSPTGTFFTVGAATLDLLLVELSGKSSTGAAHSGEVRFPDSLPVSLLAFLPCLFSLAGIAAFAASVATASRYILSTHIIASFLSDGIEMTPIGPGIFRVL